MKQFFVYSRIKLEKEIFPDSQFRLLTLPNN